MANFKISKIRYTWKGAWAQTTSFIKDDVVSYGGKTYVCLITHTSTTAFATDLAAANWVLMFDGYVWRGTWTASTLYNVGDTVKWGAIIFRCITSHTSSTYTSPLFLGQENDSAYWTSVARTEDWKADWALSTRYKVNDVVRYGATVYRCNTSHISAGTTSLGLEADQAKWDIELQQADFKGVWNGSSTRYKVNDVVRIDGSLWRCTAGHTSTASVLADLSSYWTIYLDGLEFTYTAYQTGVAYKQGDIVTYGGYAYRAIQNNQSQTPSTATSYWEIVTTNYRFLGNYSSATSYLVGDTVRVNGYVYVCILDVTNIEPPNATYWSVVNSGRQWRAAWQTSTNYKLGDIVTYKATSYEAKLAHTSNVGNRPDTDVAGAGTNWMVYIEGNTNNVLTTQGDIVWYNSAAKARLPIGTDGQVLKVSGTNLTWASFGIVTKVYYVAPNGADTAGSGTTLNNPWLTIKYACSQITGPAVIFVKSGVYSEQLPISIPANVSLVGDELRTVIIQPATGFEASNMFYVRNGSNIRNVTLQGLTGTLGTANAYGTQRPTAGAYVSLDPGAGAADSTVWITSKSPYIQNVTTFGTGCVGLKVDASLHNGGNKSIVANDFTQILSDGIGVWIKGVARSECVSVFTYFCHIGYLTEDGGRLRATNGNNSYGKFGSVSEGVDTTESPITATVNNRANQATVGYISDDNVRILRLEYDNAGQNYSSSPTISITGTGTGIVIDNYERRTAAVFQIRSTDPTNTGFPGGTSYLSTTNFAQGGSASSGTITFAGSDTNTSSQYIGLRVLIFDGKGAGQYGVISAYNNTTKIANLNKESTGTPGWDHLIPGTTLIDPDPTSQYIVEPRVTVSAPAYVSNLRNMPVSANWNSVTYGNGYFVAVDGVATIAVYSTDGITWGAGTGFSNLGSNTSVGFVPGRFVAIGGTGTLLSTSTNNGVNWSTSNRPGATATNSRFLQLPRDNIGLITSAGTSRTNAVSFSTDFTNVFWTASNINSRSLTTAVLDPARSTSATKLVEDTANAEHVIYTTRSETNVNVTLSIFARAAERTQIRIGFSNFLNSSCGVTYSLTNGSVVSAASASGADYTSVSSSITPIGIEGWYRLSITAFKNAVNSTNNPYIDVISGGAQTYSGNGSSGIYIYGAQVETGTRMTGYIPTSGSTASSTNELMITNDGVTWYTLGTPSVVGGAWAYGQGKFVTLSTGTSNIASVSVNGVTWTNTTLPTTAQWQSVTYGYDRFVAVAAATNQGAYSLDGTTWTAFTLPASTSWNVVRYGEGIFYAVAAGTSTGATSQDGIIWTARTLPAAVAYTDIAYGNPTSPGSFILLATGTNLVGQVTAGATAFARPIVVSGSIRSYRIIDPGSNYSSTPTVTIVDPNSSSAAQNSVRTSNNVLGQPDFTSRGTGWIRESATVTDASGFADNFQTGFYIQVTGMTNIPTVGSNIVFVGNTVVYKLLAITNLTGSVGNFSALLQIDTSMTTFRSPAHASTLSIRINYSQCRLTGHDFLSIGTGNTTTTNYPGTPTQAALSTYQVIENGGGRVFYTSTDQDGNFLVGSLFGVSQATGIVTLSASLFNLTGLSQLSLGAIIVGSTSAIINTISTDGTFSANSDSVISTQRAVATYISSRIGGGGSSPAVNTALAGNIKISTGTIENIGATQINVQNKSNFTGGIDGALAGQTYFIAAAPTFGQI
jgi:hypothetical protein